MANEITISISTLLSNGDLKDTTAYLADLINQTTKFMYSKVESIPTTAGGTVVTATGITNFGYCYIKNLDATNFVKLGPTSGGAIVDMLKLKAGEHCVVRLVPGISLRAIADTATCLVLFKFYDD